MTDQFAAASTKAKLVLSLLGIIAVLVGWAFSIFVVADDAKDALEKTKELEENDRVIEKKIDVLDDRLDSIERKIDVKAAEERVRDEYQKNQLKRIEAILNKGA